MYMPLTPSHAHTRTHIHAHTHRSGTPEVRKPLVASARAPGGLIGGGSENHRAVPQVSRNSEQADSTPKSFSHWQALLLEINTEERLKGVVDKIFTKVRRQL